MSRLLHVASPLRATREMFSQHTTIYVSIYVIVYILALGDDLAHFLVKVLIHENCILIILY